MGFEFGALANPLFQEVFLIVGQREVRIGRRHQIDFDLGVKARYQFALGKIARDDAEVAAEIGVSVLSVIETKLGVLIFGVRSMTFETFVRNDGTDLPIKRDFSRQNDSRKEGGAHDKEAKEEGHGEGIKNVV